MYLPFSVASEKTVMMTWCKMVDQVYSAEDDESTSDPKSAWIAAKDDTLFGLRAHVDAILYWDYDSILDIVHACSFDNRT